MSLLSQASLVVVPSGYKEDVVYSVKPTDGSGDLTFTRASDGTRVNSQGLVERVPWNLATYSEQFDNAAWTKAGATITANDTTAPNGTTTADKILANAVNSEHGMYNSTPYASNFVGEVYTYSVYAKKGTVDWLVIDHYQGAYTFTWFNLSTGTLGTVASGVTATIESVGSGWYRCSCTKAITSTSVNYIGIYLSNANNTWNFNASGSEYIYAWGAQVNVGTAKPYFPTTDRLNVPRLDYSNGCPSLLLEPQRTNLATYSEQFDNAAWVKASATISANQATSPDGTQNADLIYPTLSGSNVGTYQFNASIVGVVGTVSCYVKSAGKNWALLGTDNTSPYNVSFDLVNGVVGSVPSGYTATIQSVGNGWYKLTATFQSGSSLAYPFIGVADNTNRSVTADATNGLYIWGFQVEAGSYPTSYIPTTSASVTRVADTASKTGISSLIGQTEGTMFAEFNMMSNANSGAYQTIVNIATDANNSIDILKNNTTSELYVFAINGGVIQVNSVGISGTNILGRHKIALAYKLNDYVCYLDGVQVFTDTSATVPACSNLYVGAYLGASNILAGVISQAALFKTRLTNAELAALTTL